MEKLFTMLTVVSLAAFTVGCGDAGGGADDSENRGTSEIEGDNSIDGTPISDEILTLPDDEAKPDAKRGGGAPDGPPAKKGGN